MKKLMMTFAAVLCCAIISTVFTACSKDNESVSDYAAYTVNPSGNFSGNCLAICQDMRDALTTGMPLDQKTCKRNDAKAISICDQVYQNTTATATAHFKIVLEVTPLGNGMDNKTTTIKTYEY